MFYMMVGMWMINLNKLPWLKNENEEIIQKYSILLGQEKDPVNYLIKIFYMSKGFSNQEVTTPEQFQKSGKDKNGGLGE